MAPPGPARKHSRGIRLAPVTFAAAMSILPKVGTPATAYKPSHARLTHRQGSRREVGVRTEGRRLQSPRNAKIVHPGNTI